MELIIGLIVIAAAGYFVFFRKKDEPIAPAPYKVETPQQDVMTGIMVSPKVEEPAPAPATAPVVEAAPVVEVAPAKTRKPRAPKTEKPAAKKAAPKKAAAIKAKPKATKSKKA